MIEARVSQNITQKELSERTGITQTDISRIENGTRNPSLSMVSVFETGGKTMRLNIEKKNEGTKDTVFLTGRLDTATAPELDAFAEKELTDTKELVFDFEGLEYISSAGLRVLLKIQKLMNAKGTMKVIHVSEMIQEVFDITGFANILTIE